MTCDFKTEWVGYLLTLKGEMTLQDFASARAWRMIRRPRAPRGHRFIYNHHRVS